MHTDRQALRLRLFSGEKLNQSNEKRGLRFALYTISRSIAVRDRIPIPRLLFTSNALLQASCQFSSLVVIGMTGFDRQLHPVKPNSPFGLREQELNHLLRNWPVEPDARRRACPVRRRLCRVIRKWTTGIWTLVVLQTSNPTIRSDEAHDKGESLVVACWTRAMRKNLASYIVGIC
jgi:hypothetical protein